MKKEATTFDKLIRKIKDNRIVAYILVLGTLVIVVSQFTDAIEKISNFFSERPSSINIAGIWKTETLEDPWFVNKRYKYIFEFQTKEGSIDGILKRIYIDGKDDNKSIFEGNIKEKFVSFYITEIIQTRRTLGPGNYTWERVPYKVFFKGTVTDNKIDFIVAPDWPDFHPWRIEAIREKS